MGDSQELVYSPLTRRQELLPALKAKLLHGCQAFATLDQHAFVLCRQLGFEPYLVPTIKQQLQEFVGAGLLVSNEALAKQCSDIDSGESSGVKISCLGVPTRDRPDVLGRCLESYAQTVQANGRDMRIVVADDSLQAQSQEGNLEILASIKKRFGIECSYIGLKEKEEFARLLAERAAVPSELVRFALLNEENFPVGTGGNRNTLLLETAGAVAIQVDDDTLCRVTTVPDKREGLRFTSKYDPTEFWFLAESESGVASESGADVDFFGLHEQLLGKSLGGCIDEYSVDVPVLDQISSSFFRRQKSGGAGRVSVTALGVRGDSGLGSQMALLRLDGASRARLVKSADGYECAMENHQVLRTTQDLTVSDGTFCSGLNLGLDNRRCLPPFMPVQRTQDGVFASLVRASAEGYFGFVPWALAHQRPTVWRHDLRKRVATVHTGEIIETIITNFGPMESAGSEQNLRTLGRLLIRLSSVPAQFQEVLQQVLWRRAIFRISQVDELLRRYGGQPAFWAEDARAYLAASREAIARKEYIVPGDLSEAFGPEVAAELMRRLVNRLGQLLVVWPQIWLAAKQLRAGGVSSARQV